MMAVEGFFHFLRIDAYFGIMWLVYSMFEYKLKTVAHHEYIRSCSCIYIKMMLIIVIGFGWLVLRFVNVWYVSKQSLLMMREHHVFTS